MAIGTPSVGDGSIEPVPTSPGAGTNAWFRTRGARQVVRADLTTPPALTESGDSYLVPAGATGAWSGHTNEIARDVAGGWAFEPPLEGWQIYDRLSKTVLLYRDGAWRGFGIDASFDADAVDIYVDPVAGNDTTGLGTQASPVQSDVGVDRLMPLTIGRGGCRVRIKGSDTDYAASPLRPRILFGQITYMVDEAWSGGFSSSYNVLASTTALAGTTSAIVKASGLATNVHRGRSIRFTSGAAVGQRRTILANTATDITVAMPFSPAPASGDAYEVFTPRVEIELSGYPVSAGIDVVGYARSWAWLSTTDGHNDDYYGAGDPDLPAVVLVGVALRFLQNTPVHAHIGAARVFGYGVEMRLSFGAQQCRITLPQDAHVGWGSDHYDWALAVVPTNSLHAQADDQTWVGWGLSDLSTRTHASDRYSYSGGQLIEGVVVGTAFRLQGETIRPQCWLWSGSFVDPAPPANFPILLVDRGGWLIYSGYGPLILDGSAGIGAVLVRVQGIGSEFALVYSSLILIPGAKPVLQVRYGGKAFVENVITGASTSGPSLYVTGRDSLVSFYGGTPGLGNGNDDYEIEPDIVCDKNDFTADGDIVFGGSGIIDRSDS